jgi:outer membrane protein OmpA-like peptidoglycan-associated protein
MDMTVDVVQIPVEPEYPVAEIHQTETYFLNKRRVQLIEEVQNEDLTVEEFLAQIEQLRMAQKGSSHSPGLGPRSENKEDGGYDDAVNERVNESERNAVEKTAVQPEVHRPPQSLDALEPGKDIFTVYFPQGKSELDHIDLQVIDRLPSEQCFRVAGYASPEGDAWFNYKLSEARAQSVAKEIKKSGGRVLTVGGLGEFSAQIWPHPWPIERRVEIYVEDCPTD